MAFTDQQKKWIFVVLFVALIVIAGYMFWPYLGAIFVGILLAYFLHPVYLQIEKKVKSRILAQIILSAVSVIIIVGILVGLVVPIATQTQELYERSEGFIDQYILASDCNMNELPCKLSQKVKLLVGSENFIQKSQEFLQKSSSYLLGKVRSLLSGFVSFAVSLVILVFSLFFFLESGQRIKEKALELLPLQKTHKEKMFIRLRQTIKAVVVGNISTALLQGVIGGLLFWILGIPLPLFWGLIMTILAFIPAIGPPLIWIPAVIVLFAQGSIVKGIILLVLCLFGLGYIDNVLKPKLIGDKIRLSSFAIFLGVIGGIQAFGILGLFFGPVIIAMLVTAAEIYRGMK